MEKTMRETATKRIIRRGRVFPEIQWSKEEKARHKAENEAFHKRCRVIFAKVYPNLREKHYGWYISIEPDSGEYIIDIDKETARKKAHQKHPDKIHCLFCLNETGATGRI